MSFSSTFAVLSTPLPRRNALKRRTSPVAFLPPYPYPSDSLETVRPFAALKRSSYGFPFSGIRRQPPQGYSDRSLRSDHFLKHIPFPPLSAFNRRVPSLDDNSFFRFARTAGVHLSLPLDLAFCVVFRRFLSGEG